MEQPGPGKRGRRKGGEDAESGFSKQSNQSEAIAPPEDGGGRKLRKWVGNYLEPFLVFLFTLDLSFLIF